MVRPCGTDGSNRSDTRDKSLVRAQKYGVAAESEVRGGCAVPRSTIQGFEVGAGSGAVCWHGMDKGGTGSDGVAVKDT